MGDASFGWVSIVTLTSGPKTTSAIASKKQKHARTMRTLGGTLEVVVFIEKNRAGDYGDDEDDISL